VAGAAANDLPDPVPPAVAQERQARFMEAAARISRAKLAAKVGSRLRVLVDAIDARGAVARGPGDAPEIDGVVRVTKPGRCAPGDFLNVTVTGADAYDLVARVA
jgi:ribosomal protein S12 methylthiotransferase